MLETAVAQLRLAYSLALGRPFHTPSLEHLGAAIRETRREFGPGADGAELIGGPRLDASMRNDMQPRRFRARAKRASRETAFYQQLFGELDVDPNRIGYDDSARIPLTPKEALRADANAFVRRGAQPVLRTMTTGTTGWPTSVYFSTYELRVSVVSTYPSYLGEIVEAGLQLGNRPADFGVERICVGGEVVTEGLKERARRVFEPVVFVQGYAMTETIPFGGQMCTTGHLHFEPSHGLLPARCGFWPVPGGIGVEVVTRTTSTAVHRVISDELESRHVPVRELHLSEDTSELERPLPLRCDLRETSFGGKPAEAQRRCCWPGGTFGAYAFIVRRSA